MGSSMVENVYCDFTKLPSEAGFQQWIGFVDVKSVPNYFYGQLNGDYNTRYPYSLSKDIFECRRRHE
ncbi:hypothetical protein DAPPUDRAFT_327713 [Daphnia pulex]|uniref:Uncharacterized protein n=1 Tax=Daphnia pulex TaxID=6669 RepID=E9HBH7_DAPPU|nr:hypothetical protein DAPPUDRAFT_327713 [Daphnia pulex]|eukprot:EFX70845.1 hypothetical protein DAPPUDRAFT_327713 [Daphnia pulex]